MYRVYDMLRHGQHCSKLQNLLSSQITHESKLQTLWPLYMHPPILTVFLKKISRVLFTIFFFLKNLDNENMIGLL